MARKRDRVFALSMAVLFFITAFGFSFFVIWELVEQHKTSESSSNTASKSNSNSSNSCDSTDQPAETALSAPSVYKPSSTVSSLQVTDLTVGTGAAAKSGDCLVVQYYGTLASDGTVFDQNFTKTTGFEFKLGAGQVIKGWDQGLVGMKVGGVRRLVIPSNLAYGNQSPSETIPANSNLVFVIKLDKIK